ncbi:MAG TPA: SGNH/GDSL hydrolase family protein [Rubrivivax sp.]|nr:SGNH/GDSL hydrolase family protein [Rubrivivax sp.]
MMKLTGRLAHGALKGCVALLALGLLVSCGGSTEQVEPFEPTRLLVFGDEMSVLTNADPKGRKYSVNALDSGGIGLDCGARPIWVQIVASSFGFSFEECNSANRPETAGKIFAEPGAKADDLPAQIARAAALTGCFNEADLVTVLIGANDVLDLYRNQYVPDAGSYQDNPSFKAANDELRARGARLGRQINALTTLGPKVIVSTIPLMNLTPYANVQSQVRNDPNARQVLNDFSNTFNTAMRINIRNNGLFIGLVELDALLQAGVNDPGRYGLNNVNNAVCIPATWGTPDCDTNTLVPNGNANTWLWASDLWIGSTAHLNLGNFARQRARGNPFGSPSGTQCRPPPPPDS